MGISEFLKARTTHKGYKEEVDPDIVDLDFNVMRQDYEQGVQIGETTGIKELDHNLSWMRGHQNCWSGWPNDGKTQFTLYLMIIKSIVSGWKWCIWSPEMKKANFIDGKIKEHFNALAYDMMAMISGRTPYKHINDKYGVGLLSLDEIQFLKEWISEHFIFLDPVQKDIEYILTMHKRIFEQYGFDGFLLDPYKNIKAEVGKRDDQHLSDVFARISDASVQTNSVFNWIAHPKSNVSRVINVGDEQQIAPCNQYMLSGGAAWDNSMDGIFTPLRPYTVHDITDNRVTFHNLKQRMQDLTAQRGQVEGITFDVKKRRYLFDGRDPLLDLIIEDGKLKMIDQVEKKFEVWETPEDWKDQF